MALLRIVCALSMLRALRAFRMPPSNLPPLGGRRLSGLAASKLEDAPSAITDAPSIKSADDHTVTILQRSPRHIVAIKPPSVVCHHSGWTGSRSKQKRGEAPEIPMLQRVRDALHDIDSRGLQEGGEREPKRKVNLIHRLDRGASGALLFAYADEDDGSGDSGKKNGDTAQLISAMQHPDSIKTYVALVRGEGVLRGEDLKAKGWFEISRPIKDEGGELKDATTHFNFVAGQPEHQTEDGEERPRVSLVLARPKDGRWHQIRRHLNGLSHPILGDAIHGVSKINREWRQRGLPGERIALHLARMQLVPTEDFPEGIDVKAPLLDDMLALLRNYAPEVLESAMPVLQEEGILLEAETEYEVGRYEVPEELAPPPKMTDGGDVEILEQGEHYVVAAKPPTVVCHRSNWTKERNVSKEKWKENSPMLQRVRDKTGRRVNLVHRLDRGASGCLLFSFAQDVDAEDGEKTSCGVTRSLVEAMQSEEATKTYLALCDGDGTWNGVDYLEKGWMLFDNPVKDEWGKSKEDARTSIRFIASALLPPTDVDNEEFPLEGRKVSLVLARPQTGKWHQVRQHLASGKIGHAILGDNSHGGRTRTNRIWKRRRGLMKGRVCLHLARVQLPATEYEGIDTSCPLSPDLVKMLSSTEMSELLQRARPILAEEGIQIDLE
ncbi:hypothetical protein ACHAXT_001391 [Thalassiosira profunda]